MVMYAVYGEKWDEFVLIHGHRQAYFAIFFFLILNIKK